METFVADFERERTIVRGLRHPNVCRLYGVSQTPGYFCLVYDYLEGGSLAALLRDRTRHYDLFAIALDVAEGMDYLHRKGVMHRDLKVSQQWGVGGGGRSAWQGRPTRAMQDS
jgi:serine/threonine protein kinase